MTEKINDRWTKLKIAPFSKYSAYNFTIGPDDQILYFTSLLSPDITTRMFGEQANIWAVKLEMDGWTEPMMMGESINTESYYEKVDHLKKFGIIQGFWSLNPEPRDEIETIKNTENFGFRRMDSYEKLIDYLNELLKEKREFFSGMKTKSSSAKLLK